jgi:MoaA/NifB/PqqE/SkfB family radical SAM enzyme
LTREGAARTVEPWLLEALVEVFAAADRIGFVHGGESLTAPIFPDVLRAIQRAHAGRRHDVHLLTNGALLDGEAARRLIALGVTSVAFSLDGATAATNDAIRLGGRFDAILDNLRQVLAARRALGADLRVGISMVAGRSAAAEEPAMGRLAAALGVDWLKIEEMAPVTPLARREMLHPRAPELEAAMAALRDELRGAGVVLVDHRDPPAGCACDAQDRPDLRAFLEADDYANRACFSSCRAAWEQAAVDPDGTVRPIDYEHPPIGSLRTQTFLQLWNGEPMRRVRAQALQRVPPARREACGDR